MTKYNSIKDFLKTLNTEDRRAIEWSIEALMVEYWEMITQNSEESPEGEENGGIIVPFQNQYLIIAVELNWKGLRMSGKVQDVKVISTVEWISSYQDSKHWLKGYYY